MTSGLEHTFDHRHERGPFDIIGDVHGCADELHELLEQLGYGVTWPPGVQGTGGFPDTTAPAGRRVEKVNDVAGEIEALGRKSLRQPVDVSNRASIAALRDAALKAFGQIHILVNCAGSTKRTPTLKVTGLSTSSYKHTQKKVTRWKFLRRAKEKFLQLALHRQKVYLHALTVRLAGT